MHYSPLSTHSACAASVASTFAFGACWKVTFAPRVYKRFQNPKAARLVGTLARRVVGTWRIMLNEATDWRVRMTKKEAVHEGTALARGGERHPHERRWRGRARVSAHCAHLRWRELSSSISGRGSHLCNRPA